MSSATDSSERFSLVVGGPFHTVLRRLGLTGADLLPTHRAAIALALFAWLLPALLAVAQSLVDTRYSGWSYFTDWTVHTRYLIAITVLVATERYADERLIVLARNFRDARIFAEGGLPGFRAALAIADRRSSSAIAEGVILAVALAWSTVTTEYAVEVAGSSWEGMSTARGEVLSWAGEATRFVSNPLFLFLTFRWFWRFAVWTALLFRISRLPLQLMPMHQDGAGGLGFLAAYPGIFSGLAFALGSVVASAMLKELAYVYHKPELVWFAIGAWLLLNLLLYVGPLLVFAMPLYEARERGLIEYGRLANQLNLAFHRKWIEGGISGEDLAGSSELSAASGLDARIRTIRDMRLVPVDRPAIMQLVIAAGAPMLAVVVTLVPLDDILKWFLGKIL